MSKAQAQITISSLFDGETPVSLSLRSGGDTLQHNTDQPVPMIAEGWQGGQKLSDQELLALGTLRWYRDHGESPAAEGLTFSVKPSEAKHVEVRLERDGETASGNPVTFTGSGPVKRLGLRLAEAEPVETVQLQAEGGNCFVNEGWRQQASTAVLSAYCPLHFETADSQYTFYNLNNAWNCMVYAYEADGTMVGRISGAKRSHSTVQRTSFTLGGGNQNYEAISYLVLRYYNTGSPVEATDIEADSRIMLLPGGYDESIQGQYEPYQTGAYEIPLPEPVQSGTVDLLPLLRSAISARPWPKTLRADAGSLELIAASETLAWAEQSLASVYDGAPGEPGEDGRSSYLHVKYSDDGGATFTGNNGEDLGAWIGTCVDFEQTDPGEVTAYTWKRFADDTELRGLLDYVEEHCDRLEQSLHQDYVAVSDFGSYREEIDLSVEATARRVVESYEYQEAIAAVAERCGGLDSALTRLSGQIRRGLITDPETGETALGIAISQQLSFTGATVEREGLRYYELSPGSTLGLYTATGWQFWISGSKRGWFDSADGMLHVTNLAADSSLRLGGDWLLTADGGLGIRKL